MKIYHQTDHETAEKIMKEGFRESLNLEPASRGRVWLSQSAKYTDCVALRVGWVIEVEVPDEIAESWRYYVGNEWLGTYNPHVAAVNSYPRSAAPRTPLAPSAIG